MENNVLQMIQSSLQEKRRNLVNWLKQTPETTKKVYLGPEKDTVVQSQVEMIDRALEKAETKTLGVCEICQGEIDTPLLEMDYTASVCLDHLSDLERSRLESELEFVQVIQRSLLPQQIPEIPGLDVAVFSRPAQIVSGDYFDFFQFQDGAQGWVVADAVGHGVSASLISSGLQSVLRTLMPENHSPVDVLKRVNRAFLHNIHFTTFVTVILCRFDPLTRLLTFVNAGHNPPLAYCSKESSYSWLKPTGAAIGLAESYDLNAGTVPLSPGDILLFYTDGVTEATNPQDEPYGKERLEALVRRNVGATAQSLVRAIRDNLNEFIVGKQLEDDVTLLACKIRA